MKLCILTICICEVVDNNNNIIQDKLVNVSYWCIQLYFPDNVHDYKQYSQNEWHSSILWDQSYLTRNFMSNYNAVSHWWIIVAKIFRYSQLFSNIVSSSAYLTDAFTPHILDRLAQSDFRLGKCFGTVLAHRFLSLRIHQPKGVSGHS